MRGAYVINWLGRYRIRSVLRDSIWIPPVLAMAAALVTVRLLDQLERSMGWRSDLDPSIALAVLGAMASAMFTFIVFVSSTLLLAVQLASAQLTPRIIAFLFRDPLMKWALAAFVFIFTFTLAVLVRIGDSVPLLGAHLAAYGSLVNLGLFLYLINHAGRTLRANGALRAIGETGRRVIAAVYPQSAAPPGRSLVLPSSQAALPSEATQTVASHTDGTVLAFDTAGLVDLAQQCDCVIEVVPQVGDFVAIGDPLFRIFNGAAAAVPIGVLRHSIAIGPERTFEQDPALAFRIIADIACKALSPAINDATTAVLALDEIHHLLRAAAHSDLDNRVLGDPGGHPRLVYHTPDWSDFVNLAVTEIRQYGRESIQVTRRLRAMLENLIQTLPADRDGPLRRELALLRRSTERFFTDPEDRAMAEVCDSQGVGGRHDQPTGTNGQSGSLAEVSSR